MTAETHHTQAPPKRLARPYTEPQSKMLAFIRQTYTRVVHVNFGRGTERRRLIDEDYASQLEWAGFMDEAEEAREFLNH